jgi:ribosome biogenesis GTPase
VVPCKIKGTYRIKGIRATNPVAVGDEVEYQLTDSGNGLISQISERKNYIIRRSAKLSREYQLIAANIDQAILMISLAHPKTHLAFIDRFLVSAEAFRIPVVLMFNKIDIYPDAERKELEHLAALYEEIGYRTLAVSVRKNTNMEIVEKLLANKLSVVAGNSGVGKTTLLNRLDPSLNLKTREVSQLHKSGLHTTTYAEMFFLPQNTRIIDTPGIKGFGMVDIEREELFHFFPEIFKYSSNCKFHNCMHVNEPDCAVVEAVIANMISESRYMNYLDLLEDMGDKYRK